MTADLAHRGRLLEHAPCAYLVTTLDGLVLWTNRTFTEWLGDPDADLSGRSIHDVLTGAGRIRFESLTPALTLNGRVADVALDVRRHDGSTLNLLCNATVERVEDGSGGRLEAWWVGIDAGERREYERDLLVAQRRLGRLQDLTAALVAATTVDAVAQVLLDTLVDGVKADNGVVFLHAAAGAAAGELRAIASRSSGRYDGAVPRPDEPGDLVAEAVTTGEVVAASDEADDQTTGAGVNTHWHFLAFPLVGDDRALGAVRFGLARARPHTDEERDLLRSAIAISAQAIERVQLLERHRADALRNRAATSLLHRLEEATTVAQRAQLVADFAVPRLADFVTVEVTTAGTRVLGLRHRDRAMEPTVRWLHDNRDVAVPEGPVTRSPRIVTDIDAAIEARPELTDEQVAAIRELEPSAVLRFPLVARGEEIGALVLVQTTSERTFSDEDIDFFARIADTCALALDNARLYEHERGVASELQNAMLPVRLPDDPRVRLASFYEAGREAISIGGDWFDAFVLDDDRLGLVVGDVVGGGIGAATSMAQLRVALLAYAREGHGVCGVIERLNRFAATVDGAYACSVVYAELDLSSGELTFVCAGHPPPVLVHAGGDVEVLWTGRAPLLAVDDTAPTAARTTLAPGAAVVFYTDGLVERRQRGLDDGIAELTAALTAEPGLLADPGELARKMSTSEHGDDTCILTAALPA